MLWLSPRRKHGTAVSAGLEFILTSFSPVKQENIIFYIAAFRSVLFVSVVYRLLYLRKMLKHFTYIPRLSYKEYRYRRRLQQRRDATYQFRQASKKMPLLMPKAEKTIIKLKRL